MFWLNYVGNLKQNIVSPDWFWEIPEMPVLDKSGEAGRFCYRLQIRNKHR